MKKKRRFYYALVLQYGDCVPFIPVYNGRLELHSKKEAERRAAGEKKSGVPRVEIVRFPVV